MNQHGTPKSAAPHAGKYSNFRDPVGLLRRMLLSGNRAAYDALIRAGIAVGVSPLDWLLQYREQRRLAEIAVDGTVHPQVLIVGPPRSGSTLLYQTMARYADVSYLSNLSDLFPRSPITATSLLQRRKRQRRKNFSNYYGQTVGLASPNDGFAVWNRWLGRDRYLTPDVLDAVSHDNMRRFFAAWSAEFGKPFLNKNNRNAFCLSLLAETLPAAKFVIIRREPLFVAQSLIEARAQVQGAKEIPWGLASTEDHVVADEPLGYVNDVCDQLIKIKNRLREQQAAVDPQRCVETTYELFCENPKRELQRIAEHISELSLDTKLMSEELTQFSISAKVRLSEEEVKQIERRFAAVPAWHLRNQQNEVNKAR